MTSKISEYELAVVHEFDYTERFKIVTKLDKHELEVAINDIHEGIRTYVASHVAYGHLHKLIKDQSVEVRRTVVKRLGSHDLIFMMNDEDGEIRFHVASNIGKNYLHRLVNDKSELVRVAVCQRMSVTDPSFSNFYQDKSPHIKKELAFKLPVDKLDEVLGLGNEPEVQEIIELRRSPIYVDRTKTKEE